MKGVYGEPENTGTALPATSTVSPTTPAGWPRYPKFAEPGNPPGPPVQWGANITNATVEAGFGYIGTGAVEELDRFFYHPDHIGSSSIITNAQGAVSECMAYMPFGEILASQKSTSYAVPYLFTSKELDSETGLYYFGARYYDPSTSMWLGVDIKQENHPNHSPFIYCSQNPIILVDKDGKDWYYQYDNQGKLSCTENKNNSNEIYVKNFAGKYVLFNKLDYMFKDNKIFKSVIGDLIQKAGGKELTKIYGYSPNYGNKDAAAYSIPQIGGVYLNTNRDFTNDIFELINIFEHEVGHLSNPQSNLEVHSNVYLAAMKTNAFKKSSAEHQKGVASSFGNYLINLYLKRGASLDNIMPLINDFNKNNSGELTLTPYDNQITQTGYLGLKLTDKDGKKYIIQYSEINE